MEKLNYIRGGQKLSTEIERSAALREAKGALAELTCHLLRITAGEGDAAHMRSSLDRLWKSLEAPGAQAILFHREANNALRFTTDQHDPMENALDRALSGALGIVASRLQGSHIGELNSLSELFDGMRALEGAGTSARGSRSAGLAGPALPA